MAVIRLPRTKAARDGEDIYWARQSSPCDPEAALRNHLRVNSPPLHGFLFAYRRHDGLRPLTKNALTKRLEQAEKSGGFTVPPGHGFHIGGTLEYLLRKIPFDVMKAKGRWAGDSFLLYLRKHAEIMAPYMQDEAEVQTAFTQYAMPPVR